MHVEYRYLRSLSLGIISDGNRPLIVKISVNHQVGERGFQRFRFLVIISDCFSMMVCVSSTFLPHVLDFPRSISSMKLTIHTAVSSSSA
jgi:hypothetical protein